MNKQRTSDRREILQPTVFVLIFSGAAKKCSRVSPRFPTRAHSRGIGQRQGFIGMSGLRRDVAAFLESKESRALEARQMAALQIACHFDLAEALKSGPEARAVIVLRLERMIERERQRGMRKHWSYDLNRHIALKQALVRLRPAGLESLPSRASQDRTGRMMKRKRRPAAPLHQSAVASGSPSGTSSPSPCACGPGPFSWQAASGRPRSSAPPSGSSHPGPTFRDTGRGSGRSGSSGGA